MNSAWFIIEIRKTIYENGNYFGRDTGFSLVFNDLIFVLTFSLHNTLNFFNEQGKCRPGHGSMIVSIQF